jgi:orotidine-5'-phosphate decarboxylase
LAVSYKPNIAFYEAYGIKGWMSLQKQSTINETYPAIFTIADAKRGDIGTPPQCMPKLFLKI